LDEKLIDILYDKMYKYFVKEIDAIDNGVQIAGVSKAYSINTNLYPDWNETDKNENTQFKLALHRYSWK
jgi:uncharacterized UPF0160 family protein